MSKLNVIALKLKNQFFRMLAFHIAVIVKFAKEMKPQQIRIRENASSRKLKH